MAPILIASLAAPSVKAEPIDITVHPIKSFGLAGAEPEPPLTFLGGLQILSDHEAFGGFSGVVTTDAGARILMITDSGSVLRARLLHEDGRLIGIADGAIDSLYPDGDLSKQGGDTEDIAFDPADPSKGVVVRERQANAMLAFEMVRGRMQGFRPVAVGADNRILRSNTGLESVDYAPAASAAAGRVVAIAERPLDGDGDIGGWIAGVGAFGIVRRDGFDVSSARFLPGGDLLLLERRFSPAWGLGMRLRRIPGATIAVGARLDGPIILEAGMTAQIDNMEGLSVHRDPRGRTILTLVSDDNHIVFQRTLILQFELADAAD